MDYENIQSYFITIASTLASVILLTGCGTIRQIHRQHKVVHLIIVLSNDYDQLRSRENTMSTLWYQKAAGDYKYSIYKVTMSLLIV